MRAIALILLFISAAIAQKSTYLERITDLKDFKKLLKTKTNVLALFADDLESTKVRPVINVMSDVANKVFGKGTLTIIDCSDTEGKKLCKKFKVAPKNGYLLQHFANGEYHKDYDRLLTTQSMETFLIDPKGDAPWNEDTSAADVHHLQSPHDLKKLLQLGRPTLIMFYAPWCGHCKKLKPDYALAATELKSVGQYTLAAMDLDRNENKPVGQTFKVQGFPTLKYFNKGEFEFNYSGERTKDGLINFMLDPKPEVESAPPEPEKSWSETSENIEHLTSSTFEPFIASSKSVLVMFYAPWCGHCKAMKPAYEAVAKRLAATKPNAKLAAVDATQAEDLATKFEVKGFPTVKYFEDGEFKFNFDQREEEEIYAFMMDPKEPPPPPPPEKPWSEIDSAVRHLTDSDFKSAIKTKKHAMVMFYAPWCGHCKAAKPAYTDAADFFAKEPKVMYAAVDCTIERSTCEEFDVKGFPTIKSFNYGKEPKAYQGGRDKDAFIDFMLRELGPDFVPDNLPAQQPTVPPPENWKNIKMLDDKFDVEIAKMANALVMFFAPWCGHCKKAKPELEKAAESNPDLHFVAVDCTRFRDVCSKYNVKGYPTIFTFIDGIQGRQYSGARTAEEFANALKNIKTEL